MDRFGLVISRQSLGSYTFSPAVYHPRVACKIAREMNLTVQLMNDLYSGPAYLFSDWPNVAVPTFGAGV